MTATPGPQITKIDPTSSNNTVYRGSRIDQDKILYSIFEEASHFTNDNHWRTELIQASRGNFPTGFSYRDGIIYHRRKNKPKPTKQVISDNPEEAANEFITFMHSVGNYSDNDMIRINESSHNWQSQIVNDEIRPWTQVPEKSRREYVEKFVDRVVSTYNLTQPQSKSLKDSIQTGIVLGCFNKDNIIVLGNRIENINGIVYDSQIGLYKIDQVLLDSCCSSILKKMNKKEIMKDTNIFTPDPIDPVKFADLIVKDFEKAKENAIKLAGGTKAIDKMIPPQLPPFMNITTQNPVRNTSSKIFIIDGE